MGNRPKKGGVRSSAAVLKFWDRSQLILDELRADEPEKFANFQIREPERDRYPRMFMPTPREMYSHTHFENLHGEIRELQPAMGRT